LKGVLLMADKGYRLTAMEQPKIAKPSVYLDAIAEFDGMQEDSALIEMDGKTASAIYYGLQKAKKAASPKYDHILISRRGSEVFLIRCEIVKF
jgi:hypothetical protein